MEKEEFLKPKKIFVRLRFSGPQKLKNG